MPPQMAALKARTAVTNAAKGGALMTPPPSAQPVIAEEARLSAPIEPEEIWLRDAHDAEQERIKRSGGSARRKRIDAISGAHSKMR